MTVDALQLERFGASATDVFVLKSAVHLSTESIARLRETWEANWPSSKLLVLDPGFSIERVRTMPVIVAEDLGLDIIAADRLQSPKVRP